MRDFKLDCLAKVDRLDVKTVASIKTPAILDAVNAFISNANGVCCLAVFPVELSCTFMHATGMFGGFLVKHLVEKQRETNFDVVQIVQSLLEFIQSRSFLEEHGTAVNTLAQSIWENPIYSEKLRQFVHKTIPMVVNDQKGFEVAIDTFLAAVVVNCWTAFEALAGDLWVQSVNAQPQYLAGLSGKGYRIEKLTRSKPQSEQKPGMQSDSEQPSLEEDACSLPSSKVEITLGALNDFTKGKYDIADKMGSFLLAAKRVDFTSLKAIRENYSLAFPEKVRKARSQKIDAALADHSLDALSAVRNLIVHKAGVADAMYESDCKKAPTAPAVKAKDVLALDGEQCRNLTDPVIKISVELIKAVDSWLTATRS